MSDSDLASEASQAIAYNNVDYNQVASYRVEERINMPFGGRIVTYEVSSLHLVDQHDLGPNNVRVVTPKYSKEHRVSKRRSDLMPIQTNGAALKVEKAEEEVPERKKDYVEIDPARTYERILEKGYESIEMLQTVANRRFFDGDFAIAAKWYAKLFLLRKDIEAVYHYRFAQCLKAIGQHAKAAEMMSIFEKSSR